MLPVLVSLFLSDMLVTFSSISPASVALDGKPPPSLRVSLQVGLQVLDCSDATMLNKTPDLLKVFSYFL